MYQVLWTNVESTMTLGNVITARKIEDALKQNFLHLKTGSCLCLFLFSIVGIHFSLAIHVLKDTEEVLRSWATFVLEWILNENTVNWWLVLCGGRKTLLARHKEQELLGHTCRDSDSSSYHLSSTRLIVSLSFLHLPHGNKNNCT